MGLIRHLQLERLILEKKKDLANWSSKLPTSRNQERESILNPKTSRNKKLVKIQIKNEIQSRKPVERQQKPKALKG